MLAIANSGLRVVRTVPIHGELSRASIKAGTKEPISLDIIITCVKQSNSICYKQPSAIDYYNTLKSNGLDLSKTDFFVICASECLLQPLPKGNFDNVANFIQTYYEKHLSLKNEN